MLFKQGLVGPNAFLKVRLVSPNAFQTRPGESQCFPMLFKQGLVSPNAFLKVRLVSPNAFQTRPGEPQCFSNQAWWAPTAFQTRPGGPRCFLFQTRPKRFFSNRCHGVKSGVIESECFRAMLCLAQCESHTRRWILVILCSIIRIEKSHSLLGNHSNSPI
jgi:hypothetical protein